MSLNLKNPRAHQLATQLADLTGESLTTAVIVALELRLREEMAKRGGRMSAKQWLELGERFSAHIPESARYSDPTADLYDEDGLPK